MTDQTPPPPAYQQPQPYVQPGYGATPYPAAYGPRTNTLAIVALVLGLTVPIGGIIAGHIALGQIKRTGEAGHGLALAGAILGWVFTAFIVLYIFAIIGIAVFSVGAASIS